MTSATGNDFFGEILEGISENLPLPRPLSAQFSHAPRRRDSLTAAEKKLALKNALRYVPKVHHEKLAPELFQELHDYGRIYMYRYRPSYEMYARELEAYACQSQEAAAIMLMIMNNLDPAVAQHPEELITYGGNGSVFQNWAQYRLTMQYLARMSDQQTLVMYSGHPLGLFPSSRRAPRVIVSNGMTIPNYSRPEDWERGNALGVTQFGQMTAGSYMYIGPQGIVHGTAITVLNAGRRRGNKDASELRGNLFVTSGLGGMSGAQGKAAVIAGAVAIIAEVNPHAARKRHAQGWVTECCSDLPKLIARAQKARAEKEALALAYEGNIVDLWEALIAAGVSVDLGSDQTSLHNPLAGGYYPAGLSFDQSNKMMAEDPDQFKREVQASLIRQVRAINTLAAQGMYFWDYGNAFLLEAGRAGADVWQKDGSYRYPSYVQDIVGPLCFDYGFGPFRWVCTSGKEEDLLRSDAIALAVLEKLAAKAPEDIRQQMEDNCIWIRHAAAHKMVVGSQARILYANSEGRIEIARALNQAIANGEIQAPVVLGRDHHDVSGTDSPYRETSNIYDGSQFTADMAIQNVIGDACRGATWVSLHNGGGVGWGEVINGGFGLLIDGTMEAEERLESMLHWDVNNGIARRSWARNPGARIQIQRAMKENSLLEVTLPELTEDDLMEQVCGTHEEGRG